MITEDILLDALIDQMRTIPSVTEIVFQKKLLPTTTFLQVLVNQSEKRIDFKQACEQLSVWTEDIERIVLQEIQTMRNPLGNILIQKGLIDLSSITKALDEFLSRIEVPVSTNHQDQIDSPKEADPILIEEFLGVLNQEKINQLKNQIEGLQLFESDTLLLKHALKEIIVDLHLIRGFMNSIHLKRLEELITKFEKFCIYLIKSIEGDKKLPLDLFSTIGGKVLDLVGGIKNELEKNGHEESWFSTSEHQEMYETLCKMIQQSSLENA